MAKWFGSIGYSVTAETRPGIWEDTIEEKNYYGDTMRASHKYAYDDQVNSKITVSNKISILADPFASEHIPLMRYITYMGNKWSITDVEIQYPRLIISFGGVYNERTPIAPT